eukprot:CAMPEP_0173385676 /NCGR_PEP_ID=MMETSP1356-20130122/8284_1 /TAXON_ID=77927 ORGANISM="Hemiselmis virescens, Strain PCC157" /NCGR_SAMPLE_ID=MMETSP1356 /ASSEMBLY_ACC=CAM_ASM_000847 /LENGTH=56 /DNA_ID=CAMNT_0014341579 /DNA_START=113 /DNA_END=283 /DNA_ORIENTATION=-
MLRKLLHSCHPPTLAHAASAAAPDVMPPSSGKTALADASTRCSLFAWPSGSWMDEP